MSRLLASMAALLAACGGTVFTNVDDAGGGGVVFGTCGGIEASFCR